MHVDIHFLHFDIIYHSNMLAYFFGYHHQYKLKIKKVTFIRAILLLPTPLHQFVSRFMEERITSLIIITMVDCPLDHAVQWIQYVHFITLSVLQIYLLNMTKLTLILTFYLELTVIHILHNKNICTVLCILNFIVYK